MREGRLMSRTWKDVRSGVRESDQRWRGRRVAALGGKRRDGGITLVIVAREHEDRRGRRSGKAA